MKNALFLFLALALPLSVYARSEGTDQGNGGDLYSAEFVEVGQKVVELLRNNGTRDLDIDQLQQAVNETRVESTDKKLSLNGVPKDAINYPAEGRILFNRKRWKSFDAGQKPVIVLHEYLGIIGVDDASYRYSKKILGSFRYDLSYILECEFKGGDLNVGVDESAGMDTIVFTANFSGGRSITAGKMLPVGEFSQMIRDGNFSMAFDQEESTDPSLLSLKADPARTHGMTGHFAAEGKVHPVTCTVRQVDQSPFADRE